MTVSGPAHFPKLSVGTAQFVSTRFESGAEFAGMTAGRALFDSVSTGDSGDPLDLSGATVDLLRVCPQGPSTCLLEDATVSAGRLDQPAGAAAHYELTDATVGDVTIDCDPDTLDRYRFYRTRFEEFPFASARAVLRANRWCLHEYVGT
ncbi:MAG: two pore domain potassium channel family protein, partial [Halobaculum sp.]